MIRKVIEMLATSKSKDIILEPKRIEPVIDQSIIQDQNVMFLSRRIRISYIVSEYEKNKRK